MSALDKLHKVIREWSPFPGDSLLAEAILELAGQRECKTMQPTEEGSAGLGGLVCAAGNGGLHCCNNAEQAQRLANGGATIIDLSTITRDQIVQPLKEKIKGWINIYCDGEVGFHYPRRDDADAVAGNNRIACKEIEIEFTPGEGLS